MDTFTSQEDPLDQEIAAKEAAIAKDQATIAEAEDHLLEMKRSLEILSVEVKALKRAASLRPSTFARAAVPTNDGSLAAPQAGPAGAGPAGGSGRFRDVVDQIRAGR